MKFDAILLERELASGAAELGVQIEAPQRRCLINYLRLLHHWNRAFNLTAVRDPHHMVMRHLLDSLAVAPYVPRGTILDLGSGAGLPGVPLAVILTDRHFVLLDSNGKKTRFLTQAVSELGVGNVNVVHSRVEAYQPEKPYHAVTARAVGSLAALVKASRHLVAPGGCLLAMKGEHPASEIEELPAGSNALDVIELRVPGIDGTRHLVRVGPGPCP